MDLENIRLLEHAPPERGGWFSRTLRRFRTMPVASAEYLETAER